MISFHRLLTRSETGARARAPARFVDNGRRAEKDFEPRSLPPVKRHECRAPRDRHRRGVLALNLERSAILTACFGMNALAGEPKLPDLLPARGELPATYWEQHGWVIVLASVVAFALVGLAVFLLTRPKPAPIVPPDLAARRSLEALRGQPEDGALLMKVSGILRHYVMLACGLPPRERTTTELSLDLAAHPQLDRGLADSIVGFMRQCDGRKFAPQSPPAPASAVDTALDLVGRVESQRGQMPRAIPPQPPANSVAATIPS